MGVEGKETTTVGERKRGGEKMLCTSAGAGVQIWDLPNPEQEPVAARHGVCSDFDKQAVSFTVAIDRLGRLLNPPGTACCEIE